jgi:hypothetical protein
VDGTLDDGIDLMSYPCVDPGHFQVVDGDLTPQPYMQWRHVATNSMAALQNTYSINGGNQAADLAQLQVQWTNPNPISMNVYALLTRGGCIVTNSPRNQVYIETYLGTAQGAAPADPTASTLIGRMGNGADLGSFNSGANVPYANVQTRQGERTIVVGSTIVLPSTQTYKVRVRLRFDGQNWETTAVPTSTAETELSINTGATRLDLYAYPVL